MPKSDANDCQFIQPSYEGGEAVQWLERLQTKAAADGSRQDVEKARLMDTLQRDKKSWSTSHPRHRLLDALFGFQNYRERQQVELNRLRGLYKLTTRTQKTASSKLKPLLVKHYANRTAVSRPPRAVRQQV